MAIITLDSNSRGNDSAFQTSLTWAHTCSGENRVLYVLTSIESDTAPHSDQTVSSVTYNGVALTKITSVYVTGDNGVEIWQLIAPSTGANNIVVTYTGEVDGSFGAGISFNGVDQTVPTNVSGTNQTTPAGANVATSVTTSAIGCVLLNIAHATGSTVTLTKDASDTQLYNEATTSDFTTGVAYRITTTQGSFTSTWTTSPNDQMVIAMVAISPATTGYLKGRRRQRIDLSGVSAG